MFCRHLLQKYNKALLRAPLATPAFQTSYLKAGQGKQVHLHMPYHKKYFFLLDKRYSLHSSYWLRLLLWLLLSIEAIRKIQAVSLRFFPNRLPLLLKMALSLLYQRIKHKRRQDFDIPDDNGSLRYAMTSLHTPQVLRPKRYTTPLSNDRRPFRFQDTDSPASRFQSFENIYRTCRNGGNPPFFSLYQDKLTDYSRAPLPNTSLVSHAHQHPLHSYSATGQLELDFLL
ncbi:hypothetical protein BSAF29S_05417 [Bacillus safensis subsp. safensis]